MQAYPTWIFANDLLLFTKGNLIAVGQIVTILDKFGAISGLKANHSKSSIYFGGVVEDCQHQILDATGFSAGELPFRYLGIPLSASRLTYSMFKPLLQKILANLQHWSSKLLSYAGSKQLLDSIIFSIQAVFVLPKIVVNEIVKTCRNFLWSGHPGRNGIPLVSWDTVCRNYGSEGLNFKEILSWNKASLVKLLWKIAGQRGGIWGQWVRAYHLRRGNIWQVRATGADSWAWRSLIALRDELFHTHANQNEVIQHIESCARGGSFRISICYDWIRGEIERFSWTKCIWDSLCLPRHSFIAWLAAHRRLLTESRKAIIFRTVAGRCCLCDTDTKSCGHLSSNVLSLLRFGDQN